MTQQEFIAMLYPHALKVSQKTGINFSPSGTGNRLGFMYFRRDNNFFNIKASNVTTQSTSNSNRIDKNAFYYYKNININLATKKILF